jgi:hypothetical protein
MLISSIGIAFSSSPTLIAEWGSFECVLWCIIAVASQVLLESLEEHICSEQPVNAIDRLRTLTWYAKVLFTWGLVDPNQGLRATIPNFLLPVYLT